MDTKIMVTLHWLTLVNVLTNMN